MKLIVDGVFFQLASTGIARVWSSVLPRLARFPNLEITMLDRGNAPAIEGVKNVDFPSYSLWGTVADSFLIDQFCSELGADVFTSTFFTTPVTTPSVLVVYDMIPEVFSFEFNRVWQEKQIAVSFANFYACISENTRSDLMRFYPSINEDRAIVTHCGVEHSIFHPCDAAELKNFKKRFDISRSYYLLVGSREQVVGYKNARLLFQAASKMGAEGFEILCIGGEPEIAEQDLAWLPENVSARRLDLKNDGDLACAYCGAEALVYPSLYEGFGMPVVEAMACGCPVVTTTHGSLREVASDAAILISGHDVDELVTAAGRLREIEERKIWIEKGLKRAAQFDWDIMAKRLYELLKKAATERNTPANQAFFREWKRLRAIQGKVDVGP